MEQTAPAFGAGKHVLKVLDQGLERYRKQHRSRTRWHFAHISSFAQVRPHNLLERLVFSAATRDTRIANRVMSYFGRTVGPSHLITPTALGRAALVNLGVLGFGRRGDVALPLVIEPSRV